MHPKRGEGPGMANSLGHLWQRETSVPETQSSSSSSAAYTVGALLGVSAAAAASVAVSSMSTDASLSMLGAAGYFNEKVLFTDILMRWFDTANGVGYAVLPLAVLYLMQAAPSEYLSVANADFAELEAEACLIALEEPVCGRASFDSTDDGMMCVEDYSSGKLRWACA
eukprot:CAMPEP_0181181806 /NCGR_PEP_ID=MMETSP1096-20121128/7537_1 /TAXON_ID=156174 ORGANISM="Chrysochromulina ericina, Strain CCMP281" /NCGR_SAMPLE_ID=MMETSP1096 /ASSEMBLY_ACC=CAM_ASM_000453 /LENGTH=167 /DNA_ID=CAMNT_0023270341 /DNA_START=214 /DNA_END=717 /DNA_ORIENTATION=+